MQEDWNEAGRLGVKMLTAADAQEDGDYWEPADAVNDLYKQLCLKKYREIERQQIK